MSIVCKFCGQFVGLGFEIDDRHSEERAILLCDCPEAREYQKVKENERKAVLRREETLEKAKIEINKLFGPNEDDEQLGMSEKVIATLDHLSILIYDQTIGKTSMDLPGRVKAIITLNAKGNLSIERQDKASQKIEI